MTYLDKADGYMRSLMKELAKNFLEIEILQYCVTLKPATRLCTYVSTAIFEIRFPYIYSQIISQTLSRNTLV